MHDYDVSLRNVFADPAVRNVLQTIENSVIYVGGQARFCCFLANVVGVLCMCGIKIVNHYRGLKKRS